MSYDFQATYARFSWLSCLVYAMDVHFFPQDLEGLEPPELPEILAARKKPVLHQMKRLAPTKPKKHNGIGWTRELWWIASTIFWIDGGRRCHGHDGAVNGLKEKPCS